MMDVTASINMLLGNLIKKYHTLLDCPVRFSGQYGGQNVQHFLEYVETYKKVKCISDDQALQELGHLLTENAQSWWLRRKCHFSTWSEAKSAIQNQYSKQRPVHLIYKDIFRHSYDDYNSKEDFITDKYELFNELPDPKPSEKSKLDMIFALLPCEIQSKVDYSNILCVVELKEQMTKLENININNQNINKQNGIDILELQQNLELKEKLNAIVGIVVSDNHQQNRIVEKSAEVHIVNDKDPVIKVRRTEDLMPQVKQEDKERSTSCEQDEFISTENDITKANESINNFQIDTDIMNQINNIIDESEMQCDTVCDNMQISSVTSAKESTPTTIAFLINGHSIIQNTNTNNNIIKRKIRCSFCRKFGHLSQACLKRAKQKKLFPEKFDISGNLIKIKSVTPKDTELVVSSSNSNSNDTNVPRIPDTTITPIVSNVPSQEANNTSSTSQQYTISSTAPTVSAIFSLNTSLPSVPPPFNHITTLSTVSPTISPVTALTTKLIAPINGPGPNKQLAAKLRSINGPSPKCHQCGNVGFYKSICPNCSPIYNSNQYKSSHA